MIRKRLVQLKSGSFFKFWDVLSEYLSFHGSVINPLPDLQTILKLNCSKTLKNLRGPKCNWLIDQRLIVVYLWSISVSSISFLWFRITSMANDTELLRNEKIIINKFLSDNTIFINVTGKIPVRLPNLNSCLSFLPQRKSQVFYVIFMYCS